MSKLLEKLAKAGSIKHSAILSDSKFFGQPEIIQTHIPILNVAMSGTLDGGLVPGLTVIAGPSKHYKSNISLVFVRAYLKKYPEAVCLFYDSEFGITEDYIKANGIDPTRVIHIPIEHIEQLKFDIAKRLDSIDRGDKVVIFIDSIGNLASKKEAEDALEEKGAVDMTRAKTLKSLFRIITPHLTTKQIPCIAINHTYEDMGMFPKQIVSGGTGIYYSANTIWIIGRSQDKNSDGELEGFKFTINIEKSRFVREKSKLTFDVRYDSGIGQFSGLFDLAKEAKAIISPTSGWYQRVDLENGEINPQKYRLKELNTKDFWLPIIKQQQFRDYVSNTYKLTSRELSEVEIDEDFA